MRSAAGDLTPTFGPTGFRRVLAIAAAAVLLTGVFLVVGFPYDRLTPRITQAIETATGARVSIGRLGLGVAWLGPQLRAWDLDVTTPGGRRIPIDRLRVHPAWSMSWLRGVPSVVVAVRSPLGEIDGTLRIGGQPAFAAPGNGQAKKVAKDLQAALDANPQAKAFFAEISKVNRYAILYRIHSVKRAETRQRKIADYVQMLAEKRTIYP